MSPSRVLSHAEARRFYDAFGARQDRQGFYEEPAQVDLLEHLELERAGAIVELGCGTGRLAARILAERAPPDCRYLGTALSVELRDLISSTDIEGSTGGSALQNDLLVLVGVSFNP